MVRARYGTPAATRHRGRGTPRGRRPYASPVDDATALAARIRAGELSAAEAAAEAAARSEAADATLHALAELFADVIERPAPADGPLAGVPLLVKDLGSGLAGRRQEQGSRLHAGHVVTHTGPFLANALAAGLVPIGRTAVPELGYAFDTTTDDSGTVRAPRTPYDASRTTRPARRRSPCPPAATPTG